MAGNEVWGEPDDMPECQSCKEAAKDYDELKKVVGDLAYLSKHLVKELRKSGENKKLCDSAMDYLKRKELLGSPLREAPNAKLTGRGPQELSNE